MIITIIIIILPPSQFIKKKVNRLNKQDISNPQNAIQRPLLLLLPRVPGASDAHGAPPGGARPVCPADAAAAEAPGGNQ